LQREVEDLRRLTEELRAGRDRFRDLVENTSDWVWELDGDGKYAYVSPQVRDMLGRQADDLIGATPFDIMPPAEAQRVAAIFQHYVSRGEPFERIENVCLHADGHEVVMETSGVPVYGTDGDIRGYRGVDRDITARRRVEEALSEEHRQAQRYLNLANVIFVAMDAAGDVALVNRKACDMLGYSEDQIIGRNWFDTCLPPRLKEKVQDVARQVLRGDIEPVEYFENAILTSSGVERIIAWHNTSLTDDSGNIIGTLSSGQDITERKQAQEDLRRAKDFTETALNSQQDTFFLFDPATGRAVRWNRAFTEVVGYNDQEIASMPAPASYYSPEDLDRAAACIREVMETGIGTIELDLICKDGRTVPTEYKVSLVNDTEDQAQYVIAIGRDVAARKQAEEELRMSEAVLNATGQMANVGGWELVPETMDVRWTDQIYRIYGLPVGHMPPLEENLAFYHADDRPKLVNSLQRAIDDGEPYDLELRLTTAQDRERWVHTLCKPVIEDGKTVLLQGTFQDITERKQAEQERKHLEAQLRQAHKMEAVGQLAGGIAHDFNNILTAIMGNAELLKMDLPDGSEQSTSTDEIIKGAARAANLTRQLLAFARKGNREVTPVDIHNTVHQTVGILTHTIDRRIEIRLDLNASPSTVMGDPAQLQNALLNLGVNARDAMGDGGVLTFATRCMTLTRADCDEHPYELTPGDFLEITVTDTGSGIDQKTQKKIFEPFFTTKEIGKGTGLGLAGVYGCVRSHDGSVSVSSKPNCGATFTILLPLANADAPAAGGAVASDQPIRGTGHVLVVDDEDSVREFVRTSLQNLGYTVSTCPDGAEGIDYYREHHQEIDLIILDLIMPRMSGQDAFGEIKRIDANAKVLVSSGFSHTQATRQMLDKGALGLLSKPFQITELAQAVAKYIQTNSK